MIIQRKFLSNLHKNLFCGCSLESPWRGDSNEQPQHRFLSRYKQYYHLIIIKYHQIRTLFLLLTGESTGRLPLGDISRICLAKGNSPDRHVLVVYFAFNSYKTGKVYSNLLY